MQLNTGSKSDYDAGIWQHALGGVILGAAVLLLYYFRAQDAWTFTLCFSLIFPIRELWQHDWQLSRLFTKLSIALEAWPAPIIIWCADIAGRIIWSAT